MSIHTSGWLEVVALLGASVLLVGCGGNEPEAVAPQNFVEPAPSPELAAASSATPQAQGTADGTPAAGAATGEIAIGVDETTYADTDATALTEFREPLAQYGAWVEDQTYGTVWIPHRHVVGPDFVPYATAGHWAYQDEYVWVSDYDWGWAPFHYGRWAYTPGGWAWIPGRRYAGAWVVWRTGPVGFGYVGWAPMAPTWYWRGGYAWGWGYGSSPAQRYVYCPSQEVFHPGVGGRILNGPAVAQAEAGTRTYTPASPTVGGVAGHSLASPTVGGHTPASPTVGGRSRTRVAGPDPHRELGIQQIAAPPKDHVGLARATAYAEPHTATAVGASRPLGAGLPAAAAPAFRAEGAASPRPSRLDPVATAPRWEGAPRTAPDHRIPSYTTPPGYDPPRASRASPSFDPSYAPRSPSPSYDPPRDRGPSRIDPPPRVAAPMSPSPPHDFAPRPSMTQPFPPSMARPSGPTFSGPPVRIDRPMPAPHMTQGPAVTHRAPPVHIAPVRPSSPPTHMARPPAAVHISPPPVSRPSGPPPSSTRRPRR